MAPPLESCLEVVARLGGDVSAFLLCWWWTAPEEATNRVLVCRDRDGASCIAVAGVGEWSEWAVEDFAIDGNKRPASLRFKLMDLAADGSRLKLYRTQVTYTDGFTVPDELAGNWWTALVRIRNTPPCCPIPQGWPILTRPWKNRVPGNVVCRGRPPHAARRGCSFFICHWHLYDYLNHIHLGDVDPVCPGYEAERAEQYVDYFRRAYQGGGPHFGTAVGGRG